MPVDNNQKCPKCGGELHPGNCYGAGGGSDEDEQLDDVQQEKASPTVVHPASAGDVQLPDPKEIIPETGVSTKPTEEESQSEGPDRSRSSRNNPFSTDIPKPRPDDN